MDRRSEHEPPSQYLREGYDHLPILEYRISHLQLVVSTRGYGGAGMGRPAERVIVFGPASESMLMEDFMGHLATGLDGDGVHDQLGDDVVLAVRLIASGANRHSSDRSRFGRYNERYHGC